jgi:hypothetical protein
MRAAPESIAWVSSAYSAVVFCQKAMCVLNAFIGLVIQPCA